MPKISNVQQDFEMASLSRGGLTEQHAKPVVYGFTNLAYRHSHSGNYLNSGYKRNASEFDSDIGEEDIDGYQNPADEDIHRLKMVMAPSERRFGFSVIGGADEGFGPRVDDITLGSPADRAELEVGDEIIEVNSKNVENCSHTEVIAFIHQCIRSKSICLRVKRPKNQQISDIEKVHDAYIIAVEDGTKHHLESLPALQRVTPRDMTKLLNSTDNSEAGSVQSDISVEDNTVYVSSMPTEKTPKKKKANGHAKNGDVNGSSELIEMNGVLEKESPKKGKKSKKESRKQKVASTSETPLIEEMNGSDRLSRNGNTLSQNSLNLSKDNIYAYDSEDFDPSMQNSFEFEDSGPHREMAIDCPDSFVGTIKTAPRYPPPNQNSLPRVPPTTPMKHALDNSSENIHTEAVLNDAAVAMGNQQQQPTMEQLERLRKHQEELRKRREEETRHFQEEEFLRTSLRGSKKLQALEDKKTVPASGVVNTAFIDGEDEEVQDGTLDSSDPLTSRDRFHAKRVDMGDMFQSLQYVRSQLNSNEDQGDITFLKNLFLNGKFQHAVNIHNKIVEVTSQSPQPRPVASNGQNSANNVINSVQQSKEQLSEELVSLLNRPHMKGVLLAHDSLAQREHEPVTVNHVHALPHTLALTQPDASEPLEYPLMPYGEDSVKIIHLEKTNEPLGATVKNEGDSVIIGRIVKGGAAEKSGLLHEGDEILEVNGIDMRGKNVNDVSEMLAYMTGTITFMIIPTHNYASPKPAARPKAVHLRALFNYDPEDDAYIPCRELGLSFMKGDILHIINQDDPNWWQAYREGEEEHQSLAGLIPSRLFHEQRETLRQTMPGDGKDAKKKGRSCVCGKRDKKKKKKKRSSLYTGADEETEEILSYEEMVKYLPQPNRKRPIALIGPSNVGRAELRQRLMESDFDRFAAAVPHTSRVRKPEEIEGKDYHFISRTMFEADILAQKFIEYGEFEKNLYGTSLEAVRQVIHQGKICVLNLHADAVKPLYTSDLKPYVIFVCPPNLEKLRAVHVKLGKPATPDDELKDIIEKAREMEDIYGHYFDYILVNQDLNRAYDELLQEINRLEIEPQWIPKPWVDTFM
ncbi:protein PALS1-like isoform X2 [Haliotis rufescens]|uniref:protein PALS1-like isoform X2 n=1 Tax=Haliotis rufescens TaxID=6454 RepID=UPI00201FA061|nr:protein PALS1-like isoform X2 [Haliotis rufescens]